MRRRPDFCMALLAAPALLGAVVAAGCGEGGRAGPAARRGTEPVEVAMVPVEVGTVARAIEVTGTLFGEEETTISAKLAGRVAEVLTDFGDAALPGAPLARLETMDYELALAERRAAMLAALARLGLGDLPETGFDPSDVPSVARARAEAANAVARYERGRQLFDESPPLISEEELADLRTAVEVAENSATEALVTARAVLAEARTLAAQVAVAEQRLTDTEIRAPGNEGDKEPRYLVAERLVSEGEFVVAGREAFRLVASDLIKFRADVPERFDGQVRVGQEARVWVESHAEGAAGKVARVAPSIDAASRTFQIEVHVENRTGQLKPGAFARGRVVTRLEEGVTLVPESAVVSFAGTHRVFSVKDGKAVEHRVKLGARQDGAVEIVGGLGAAEVVGRGGAGLSDGTPVRVSGP